MVQSHLVAVLLHFNVVAHRSKKRIVAVMIVWGVIVGLLLKLLSTANQAGNQNGIVVDTYC